MTTFEASFEELFASAYKVAYVLVGTRSDAEDIAQEALARALVRWRRLAGHEEAWVVRVATNLALDQIRASRRRLRITLVDGPVTEAAAERLDLQRALASLSTRQREVAVLRFVGGFSVEQTAQALGCSAGSVKQHSSRAMSALRGLLGEGERDNAAAT